MTRRTLSWVVGSVLLGLIFVLLLVVSPLVRNPSRVATTNEPTTSVPGQDFTTTTHMLDQNRPIGLRRTLGNQLEILVPDCPGRLIEDLTVVASADESHIWRVTFAEGSRVSMVTLGVVPSGYVEASPLAADLPELDRELHPESGRILVGASLGPDGSRLGGAQALVNPRELPTDRIAFFDPSTERGQRSVGTVEEFQAAVGCEDA